MHYCTAYNILPYCFIYYTSFQAECGSYFQSRNQETPSIYPYCLSRNVLHTDTFFTLYHLSPPSESIIRPPLDKDLSLIFSTSRSPLCVPLANVLTYLSTPLYIKTSTAQELYFSYYCVFPAIYSS